MAQRKRARPKKPTAPQLILERPDGSRTFLGFVEHLNISSAKGELRVGPGILQPMLTGRLVIEGVVNAPDGIRVTLS